MTKSNYWIERPVSNSSNGHAGVHQASKDFIIIVSDSADFSPSMEVCVGRADCFSIQVPRSTKTQRSAASGKMFFCSISTRHWQHSGALSQVAGSTTLTPKTTPSAISWKPSMKNLTYNYPFTWNTPSG